MVAKCSSVGVVGRDAAVDLVDPPPLGGDPVSPVEPVLPLGGGSPTVGTGSISAESMHPNVSADAFPSGAIVGCVAPTLGLLRHTRRKPSRGCREHAPGGETGRGVQLAGAVEPLVVAVVRAVGLGLGAESVVPAIALAAAQVSGLHGVIFGDGPQHDAVIAALERPEISVLPGSSTRASFRRRCAARAAWCCPCAGRAMGSSCSRPRCTARPASLCASPTTRPLS